MVKHKDNRASDNVRPSITVHWVTEQNLDKFTHSKDRLNREVNHVTGQTIPYTINHMFCKEFRYAVTLVFEYFEWVTTGFGGQPKIKKIRCVKIDKVKKLSNCIKKSCVNWPNCCVNAKREQLLCHMWWRRRLLWSPLEWIDGQWVDVSWVGRQYPSPLLFHR